MTTALPPDFVNVPIAHRGLHDASKQCPENSRAAIRAAIDAGYGIEMDLQLSADGEAMVFHDYHLGRLTSETGLVRERSSAELQKIPLLNGDGETIPTLVEILSLVDGRVALLLELKDQDGAMGPDIGGLEAATARALTGYSGRVALMSFNPHSVNELGRIVPSYPRGLVTSDYDPGDWPLPREICDRLREIPDFEPVGASFVSHEATDLGRARVQKLRDNGAPVLCWTIRSAEAEAHARQYADNVTFEGYRAKIPA
ncbi:MAG: glycerophosphodiester phosphodiesterase family protein [Arenibacterium sp.]